MHVVILTLVFAGTILLTGIVRQFALRQNLLDMPNERSSHIVPTPRGGGIAIVALVVCAWTALGVSNVIPGFQIGALILGALGVAVVGYYDDQSHVPVIIRLSVHLAAALGIVVGIGYPNHVLIPGGSIELGVAGAVVAVLYVVWLLNLTNFMDGIDGIAAAEAITVTASAAGLMLYTGDIALAVVTAVLGAGAAGFLFWNWPPARIFMGDVGSGFVGFSLGSLSVLSHVRGSIDLYVWTILLGTFVVDATITLLRRLISGQKIYEAHRSHAYQNAAIRFRSHAPVTIAVGVVNLVWLTPIAFLVVVRQLPGMIGLGIAYLPLILLVLYFRAGRSDESVRQVA